MTTQRLTALVAAAGASILSGPLAAQTSPSPFTSGTRYDGEGRVTGTIAADPDGSGPLHHLAVRNTYDAAGRLISVEKGELAGWQSDAVAPAAWPSAAASPSTGFTVQSRVDTEYDALGRKLVERVSAGGTTFTATQYSYDAVGRLQCTAVRMNPSVFASLPASACALGPEGAQGPDRITRAVYDPAGQLVQVLKGVGTALEIGDATYGYSANGQRTVVIDANGNKATLEYDGHDRQVRWTFPSSTTPGQVNAADYEEYGYDGNGNRTSLRKRDGRVLTFGYDALNRMTSKLVPDGCAPIQVGACPAATATRDVYYGYDLRGLQLYARFDSATGEGITDAYDGLGRLTAETVAVGGASRTLGYEYDANGNRTRIIHPDGLGFRYEYDGLDRATLARQADMNSLALAGFDATGTQSTQFNFVTFGHDGVGRLSSITAPLGNGYTFAASYGYNPASQITTRTQASDVYAWTGAVNVSRPYAVNGLNQYTTAGAASFSYDANGNLIGDGTSSYVYDAENRLVAKDGGVGLSYDPRGRLWSTAGPSGTTAFLYDGDQLSVEYDAAGTVLRRYLHGPGEDDPLFWYEGPTESFTAMRGLITDHQGSVVMVMNNAGTVLGTNTYDEHGIPGTGNLGRFQYTGQAWMPDLGMYYYKARFYSPTLGRFMQTDPIGYKDQVNLYAYVANDPVNGVDPTGECTGSNIQGKDGQCAGGGFIQGAGSCEGNCSASNAVGKGNLLMPQGNGVPRGGDTMATHQADIDDVRAAQGDLSQDQLADRREARALGASFTPVPAAAGAKLTISTTAHGAERLAGAAATRGGVVSTSGYWAARVLGRRMTQSDGASVFLRQHLWGGRSDFIVLNRAGKLISSGGNWSEKSIARNAKRFGWQ